MRYILTNNSHVQFIEADDNGKILKSRGFEFGGVYYQITNNKVTFYLKDQDQPWVNNVWSADIPLMINGEVYSTPEEVGVQLSTIMTDGNIADKIAEIESDIAEIVTNESALTDSLDAEIARATSAETEIANDLDAEIARAEAAEEDLDDKIDAEITRANAEETRIEGLINAEVTRSTNKDIEHDMLISGLTDASDALDAKIDKEIADRISGDTNLQNQLTAETARAEGEEARIEGLINDEVTRSTAKDASQDALISGLTTSLQNEINRAQGAENGLRNDLNNEVSARTTADAEQLQRITALEVGKANASDVYTKAESDAKYVTKEYISGNTYTKAETDALIVDFYDGVEYDSNAKRINFMHGNAIKSYIDASAFIKDGMVDNVVIENGYLVITFNTDSRKEAISIPLSDIFDPTNYYTKNEVDASQSAQDTKITALSGDVTTISGDVATLNEKVETISGDVQTISGDVQVLDGKIDTLSGEVQTLSSETVTISGSVQTISGEVQTIKEEVDDIDLTNYYNKTEVDDLLDDKLDASAYTPTDLSNYYTKSEVDASQSAQDTKINEISGNVTTISGDVQTISGNVTTLNEKVETISGNVTTISGEVQTLSSEIDDIDLSNYYTKSESDGKYQLKGDYVTGAQLSAFTYDKETIDEKVAGGGSFDPTQYYNKTATDALLDEKLDVTAYTLTVDSVLDSGSTNPVENRVIYNKIDEVEQVTAAALNNLNDALNDKQDTLTAGSGISIVDNVISATGGSTPIDAYTKAESDAKFATITNFNSHSGNTNIHVTAAEKDYWDGKSDFSGDYDDLINQPTEVSTFNNDAGYITASDLDEYPTTSDVLNLIDESVSGKQDTLTAGSGISIVNNVISATGGGGSTYSAGTNIDITNDIISCTLNASNGSGAYSFTEGWATYANKRCAHAEGEQSIANGLYSHAEGYFTKANADYSHTEGYQTNANNKYEHASGVYNASNSATTTFGDSRNTLFSVGNGTSINARHNAFEIRQNGDIYLSLNGQDVKLQDQLGGGGGVTPADVQTMIDESISGKTDESDFSAHTANTAIHVTTAQTASWDAKSNFSGSYNDLTDKPTIPTVPTSNTAFTNDAGYITSAEAQSAITAATSGLQETLSAGTNVSITNNVISATDTTYTAGDNITISNQNVISTVTKFWCGTQAEYDLIQNKDSNTVYMIHE